MLRRLALLLLLIAVPQSNANSGRGSIFAEVVRRAQSAANTPYQPNEAALPEVLQKLNYDTYRKISFRPEAGLWRDDHLRFQAQFFHPGYLYKDPVAINEVVAGEERAVEFSPKFFRYPHLDPAPLKDAKLGFAGFRLLYPLNHRQPVDELISFLGSSYFRALGARQVYGISARGIAINTAENMPEEFPAFREFWLCRPAPGARELQFFALLDGPSVSGAYKFLLKPGPETTVEVEARLFFRKPVEVLGLAPLTSMFWRDQPDPKLPNDKRPEVHDSDTLLIEQADGTTETHRLRQVDRVTTQLFPEKNPKSFGLLQRDRDPAHYLDREAHYDRRPSVRVESLGEWGAGTVHLMELPTANEYNDNVVAFWQPEKRPAAGDELQFKYRLHWLTEPSNKE